MQGEGLPCKTWFPDLISGGRQTQESMWGTVKVNLIQQGQVTDRHPKLPPRVSDADKYNQLRCWAARNDISQHDHSYKGYPTSERCPKLSVAPPRSSGLLLMISISRLSMLACSHTILVVCGSGGCRHKKREFVSVDEGVRSEHVWVCPTVFQVYWGASVNWNLLQFVFSTIFNRGNTDRNQTQIRRRASYAES